MGFFSSFTKAFSSSSAAVEANHTKNSFAGTVHTAPPKKAKDIDRKIQQVKDRKEIMEVMLDDEFTEDMERMMKTSSKSYQTQQAQFRKAVLEKFEEKGGWYTCAHCGKKFRKSQVEADHVIPRSAGGTFSVDNGQILCISCNRTKHDSQDQTDEDLKRLDDERKQTREDDVEFLKYVQDVLDEES